jgi:hypothetical protein
MIDPVTFSLLAQALCVCAALWLGTDGVKARARNSYTAGMKRRALEMKKKHKWSLETIGKELGKEFSAQCSRL